MSTREASFINYWKIELERFAAEQVLRWALETYPKLVLVASFDDEYRILISMLARMENRIPIIEDVPECFLNSRLMTPKEELSSSFSEFSTFASPEYDMSPGEAASSCCTPYCRAREWEHFVQKMPVCDAWIVGTRREQSPAYAKTGMIEWDEQLGLVRIAPLIRWTNRSLREKIRRESIPVPAVRGKSAGNCRAVSYRGEGNSDFQPLLH